MTTPLPPTYYPPLPEPTPISPLVGGLGDMPMPRYVPPRPPSPVENSASRLVPYQLPDGTVIQISAGTLGAEPPPYNQPSYPDLPKPPTPTVAPPTPQYGSDQIQQFINANIQDPYAVAQAAMQNNISVNDIARAMNVDPSVVTGYFNKAQIGTPDQTGSDWAMPTYPMPTQMDPNSNNADGYPANMPVGWNPNSPNPTQSTQVDTTGMGSNVYPMPTQMDPNSSNGYPSSMPYGWTPNSPTPTQAPQIDPSGSYLTPLDQYLSSLDPNSTTASQ